MELLYRLCFDSLDQHGNDRIVFSIAGVSGIDGINCFAVNEGSLMLEIYRFGSLPMLWAVPDLGLVGPERL